MPSQDFVYTGGWKTFTVPDGVTKVTVTLMGGGSGSARSGKVVGNLAVTPKHVLYIACGAVGNQNSGNNGGAACFGGGGQGGRGNNGTGGDGGGGATVLRSDSTSGTLKAVAGGAGGTSGDGGRGGSGGTTTGQSGEKGNSGQKPAGLTKAEGGNQSTGGAGGISEGQHAFNGSQTRFPKQILQPGGAGGAPASSQGNSYGGGGGGGGYHPGGGGAAAARSAGVPGGGGGGGSNYVGGLTAVKNERGTGTNRSGTVSISWGDPPPAEEPPNPPSNVTVGVPGNPKDEESEMSTRSTGTVRITGTLTDPNPEDMIRLLVRLTTISNFSAYTDIFSGYFGNVTDSQGPNPQVDAWVDLTGLAQDTHYYARLYAQDNRGVFSENFNSIDFWTNRGPTMPELRTPPPNANRQRATAIGFTWSFEDEDTGDSQSGFQLQYRTSAGLNIRAGDWTLVDGSSTVALAWTAPANTFKGNTFYDWQVRNKDLQGRWSDWSFANEFFIIGTTVPPTPLVPSKEIAVDVSDTVTFGWRFNATNAGDVQTRADFRYRVEGQDDTAWRTVAGVIAPGAPGAAKTWTMSGELFPATYCWEWQVRTYDQTGVASDWSGSAEFWAILTPGHAVVDVPPVPNPVIQGSLGCGTYRVFLYDQGGRTPRGEIEPLSALTFSRKRDDMSTCLITTNGFGADCCQMYEELRCWAHEIVVFRDGQRVWEGPITRIGYMTDSVEIEARDVMAYLYRRIMRQGFNDSFQMVDPITGLPVTSGGVQLGLTSVVNRATRIALNALAPWDPNVLPYLTALSFSDDARQSRVIADYTQTAWEQIDDLAATAGLDYTVVGRRILFWDTHRPIGRLPEMRDGDFNNPPVVTEYGMQTCNYGAVTNGSGLWGAVRPKEEPSPNIYYGPVEMVASAYDEASSATDEALTPAARQALVSQLQSQAERNIAGRWPSPLVVRVPDNSTLNPNIGVNFEQLVPGVWIPLRSTGTCRSVAQWQKLDSVGVSVDSSGSEQVQVVMSPAPNFGRDPDADSAAAEAAGG